MEGVLLLAILVGLPIMVFGGSLYLISKLLGKTALNIACIAIALLCAYQLVLAYNAPPVLGNKAAYASMADATTAMAMVGCLSILLRPLWRRYWKWENEAGARDAAEAEQKLGRSE